MISKEFLESLLQSHTPSGYETQITLNEDSLKPHYYPNSYFERDNIDNIYWSKGSKKDDAKIIMISAHYDENALQVSRITKDGMLHIINLGGLDRKTIEGSHVLVQSDEIDTSNCHHILYPGIIGKNPIHKESVEDREKVDKYKDILVDIGADSEEDVKDMGIHVGSLIVFKKEYNLEFGKNGKKIVANDLDDKIGVYCVSEAYNRISEEDLIKANIRLYLVWCSQEEVGLRGATVISKQINPDISIDVDVTFDTEIYKGNANDSLVKLGGGVVLDYGPQSRYNLLSDLKTLANNYAISYQEAVAKPGGNNCHAIQMNSKNCLTAHLGIPNRNMHTQVEMCHWDDVNSCIDLITTYINSYFLD